MALNRNDFIDELALLSRLRHPNIMQFLGAVTKSQPLVIVTEYLPKVLRLSPIVALNYRICLLSCLCSLYNLHL